MKRKKMINENLKKNQGGQVLVEAVLLLTLVVGLWGVFSKFAKQQKWFDSMVNGPWQSMSGMIENGVWEPPQASRTKHPNGFTRVISLRE